MVASVNCSGQSSAFFPLSLPTFCDHLLEDTQSKYIDVSLPHLWLQLHKCSLSSTLFHSSPFHLNFYWTAFIHICGVQYERSGYMGTMCKNVSNFRKLQWSYTLPVFSGPYMLWLFVGIFWPLGFAFGHLCLRSTQNLPLHFLWIWYSAPWYSILPCLSLFPPLLCLFPADHYEDLTLHLQLPWLVVLLSLLYNV